MDDMELNQEPDIIEMTDDEGNTILMEVIDYFFYNGDEYVILTDSVSDEESEEEEEEVNCYVMKVVVTKDESGEEFESFEPIEDEKLESKLIEVASNVLDGDGEDEE